MGLDCLSDYEARPPTMTDAHRMASRGAAVAGGTDPWSKFVAASVSTDGEAWCRRKIEADIASRAKEREREREWEAQLAAREREREARERKAEADAYRAAIAARVSARVAFCGVVGGDGDPDTWASEVDAEIDRINAEIARINAGAGECR